MATQTKKMIATFCLSLFIIITILQSQNILNIASGQDNVLPFEIGDITGSNENINDTSYNNSNSTLIEENDNCVMPPCPPGQACIQSCP